jgi:hypothetical protein
MAVQDCLQNCVNIISALCGHAILIVRQAPRLVCLLAFVLSCESAGASAGAAVPWARYEAESVRVNGGTLGPYYTAGLAGTEASGRKYVQLSLAGQYVQFTNQAPANALVVRYSVPDSANGAGADYTLSLYTNDVYVGKLQLTSKYSWLYGAYPFTNYPAAGSPRNFYDEVRTNGLSLKAGDVVKLQKDAADTATSYIIDLLETESVTPLSQPAGSRSIMNDGAYGDGIHDDTAALNNCISNAVDQGKSVWLPAATYKISSAIGLPSNLILQGAGMWYATLVGDPGIYGTVSRRVSLIGNGTNIHLSDFAIIGRLNYRNDNEANDGIGGSFGSSSTISRIWVEHTKTGAWIVNSQGLVVDSCRFRNTIADGINVCMGMQNTVVTNCTARGTGDDCFAIWPANYGSGPLYLPGNNVVTHCTAQCPFLANGGAIYGGASNRIEDCLFQDMPYGCGILISTTFPVSASFSGTTVAHRCDLNRCGGDSGGGYGWRAALQLCLDTYSGGMSGVSLSYLNITNSVSDGLSVIGNKGPLSSAVAANVSIPNYGIGVSGRHGLWARSDASGSMTVSNCSILEYKNDSATFNFNFVTNTLPPAQSIHGMIFNGDSTVTLTYSTMLGFRYHVESASRLAPALWAAVSGSMTTATGTSVTFTDLNPPSGGSVFYRTASP